MSMLEETGSGPTPGRWVLMPKKDERFVGPLERARQRVRERRKRVLMVLLEAVGASLLIGAAPPLHRIWVVTGMLVLALVAYCALLVHLRRTEEAAARRRAAIPRQRRAAPRPRFGTGRIRTREEDLLEAFEAAGLQVAAFDGPQPEVRNLVWEDGIRIIEDDVHVVVRRPDRWDDAARADAAGR